MSLQERLEIIRSSPTTRGEAAAKFRLIAPVLQNLDWDPSGPEVLYEHSVGGKVGGRVDIALRSGGRVVALIEAKAPGSNLSHHVTQVLGYAFHEGVDICVLTTGLEWWLYLPRESGPPPERRFAVLRIADDPVERLLEDFNVFLRKEMLVNGQAERRAKARLEEAKLNRLKEAQLNKEIPRIWNGMLREPDDELVELLSRRVYEKVNQRPNKPQVVAALQRSPILPAAVPAGPPARTSSPTQPTQAAKREEPRPNAKPIAMELWGERQDVESHADALRKVLDALQARHSDDFHRVLEVRGHKYPYAARNPEMFKPDGRRYNYEQLSSGYFFDLWLNAEGFRDRARRFLAHFGHDPSEFRLFYE